MTNPLTMEERQPRFFWGEQHRSHTGISCVIADVQASRTSSLEILNRSAGAQYELKGWDWRFRIPRTEAARAALTACSQKTLERLKPRLEYIASQISGFHWRPTRFSPTDPFADKTQHGCIRLDLDLGEKLWDGPYRYSWRSGSVEIAGRKIKICVSDAATDNGARNMSELVRLDGSILVVDTGKNSFALERATGYIAALAAEGVEPGRHWRRQDYEDIHGAEIKTPQWARTPRLKHSMA